MEIKGAIHNYMWSGKKKLTCTRLAREIVACKRNMEGWHYWISRYLKVISYVEWVIKAMEQMNPTISSCLGTGWHVLIYKEEEVGDQVGLVH